MEKIWIQLILLIGIAAVAVTLTRSTADARHQAVRRVLLVGFVLATAAAIIYPSFLSQLARLVGVGRGTDLVLYALVIAFLSYVATMYRRMKLMDRQITALTREIALAEVRLEQAGYPTNRPPAKDAGSTLAETDPSERRP
ncbi:DUF2304 domain-containing protein [Occultella aeris]|uniref:DUF2304 domain-containing protein n=1 Tax=Occultella aeris TaxID=2761496 RepID=A0A7M4DNU7_9MICO|nr:DUF2304 domain-containing protein [Occultella aeris]VZO39133.1 hypothetical protein HALOF300_03828 [Occultella aeris]